MRVVQFSGLGELSIAEIRIDARSRDDIPAVLHRKSTRMMRSRAARLEESLTRRRGMQLWRIFVLATLKQGLNCDFDRLQRTRIITTPCANARS